MSTTVSISPTALMRIYNNGTNNCPIFSNRNVVRKCEIVCRRVGGHGVNTIAEFKSTYCLPTVYDDTDLHTLIGIYFLFEFNQGPSRGFIRQFDEKISAAAHPRPQQFRFKFNRLINLFKDEGRYNFMDKIREFKSESRFFSQQNVPAVPRVNPVVENVPAVPRVNRAVTSNGGRRFRIRSIQLPRNQIIADAMSVINDELNRTVLFPTTVTVNKNVIPEHIKVHLRAALVATRSNRCPVCLDDFYEKPVTDCVVTDCGHYICAGCHAGCMTARPPQCCECRAPL